MFHYSFKLIFLVGTCFDRMEYKTMILHILDYFKKTLRIKEQRSVYEQLPSSFFCVPFHITRWKQF